MKQNSNLIGVRLKDEDFLILQRKMKKGNYTSKSKFIIDLLRGTKIFSVDDNSVMYLSEQISILNNKLKYLEISETKKIKTVTNNFVKIGNNINQISQKINMTNEISITDFRKLEKEVSYLMDEWNKFLKEFL